MTSIWEFPNLVVLFVDTQCDTICKLNYSADFGDFCCVSIYIGIPQSQWYCSLILNAIRYVILSANDTTDFEKFLYVIK